MVASVGNRVCGTFGIRLPLLMGAISPRPKLAAAVCAAGGLGCIEGISSPEKIRQQVRELRTLTDAPFCVNFPLAFGDRALVEARVKVAIEEQVPAVMTSAGSPRVHTRAFQDAGIKVAHVVAGIAHAEKAAEAGVDALIAEPTESGGYRGANEIAMMVLVPAIARAVPDVPLVAAGSVADRAGLVAVLALGAEGVQLGTRLMVTQEGRAFFPEYVERMVLAADDTSTMSADGPTRPRVCKPEFAERVVGDARKRAQMGQVAALIHDVPSVAEVVRELFEGGAERAREVATALDRLRVGRRD
ncbi:MAG: nitronate monooxygenase [Myxococcota bacterium]